MARAGLGAGWNILFANDIDQSKASIYKDNWGDAELAVGDVAEITTQDIPGFADLSWASFPCQDLSLAGSGGGLGASRSGTFWPFWKLMQGLGEEGRAPSVIVLENVYGAVRSHGGKDFSAIISAVAAQGYKVGAMLIDAVRFVPQSRLRLFIIGVKASVTIPEKLTGDLPTSEWHSKGLVEAYTQLPDEAKAAWVWWKLPTPSRRTTTLADLIEDEPTGVEWNSSEKTAYLLGMMADVHLQKVKLAQQSGYREVGTVYRRMRPDADGKRMQRAEVRFDGVSGCLRTPTGGSSRQTILVVEGESIRSRLLSPREAARLMGLPDSYKLPSAYNAAYHLAGDGVVTSVVHHLAEHLLRPLLAQAETSREKVAA